MNSWADFRTQCCRVSVLALVRMVVTPVPIVFLLIGVQLGEVTVRLIFVPLVPIVVIRAILVAVPREALAARQAFDALADHTTGMA